MNIERPSARQSLTFLRSTMTERESLRISRTTSRARMLLELIEPISLDRKRRGGYLACARVVPGIDEPVFDCVIPLGRIPPERLTTYFTVAIEKVRRLFRNRTICHVSSFQSRAEGRGRYGGAVLGGTEIRSFSGLEELDDEALILQGMCWDFVLTTEQALHVAKLSGNPQYHRLSELVVKDHPELPLAM